MVCGRGFDSRRLHQIPETKSRPLRRFFVVRITPISLSKLRNKLAPTEPLGRGCPRAILKNGLRPAHEGNFIIEGRSNPSALFDQDPSSMDLAGGYDREDARGFTCINAVRSTAHHLIVE